MSDPKTKAQLESWQDELDGAALYQALSQLEKDPRLAEIYRRFADAENRHARAWADRLTAAGLQLPPHRPTWRTRTLIWLARRLGTGLVLPTIVNLEQVNVAKYRQSDEGAAMAPEEASHARLLQQVTHTAKGGLEGGALAQIEGRHRAGGGNALRAAVLGANDGLVSNLSLVMGVAGAQLAGQNILITGLAGLLAGACSMALGEWLSVQSSRELYQRQIAIEKAEIEAAPEEEAEELSLIYQARGLAPQQAKMLADQIMSNHESALATLTREELGIDPEELGGSAYVAAITSFLLFAIGAIIPVIPFFPVAPFSLLGAKGAILTSAAFATVGLYAIGAATSMFTGKSTFRSGLRMVIFGLAAAAITFSIGHLIGATITG